MTGKELMLELERREIELRLTEPAPSRARRDRLADAIAGLIDAPGCEMACDLERCGGCVDRLAALARCEEEMKR